MVRDHPPTWAPRGCAVPHTHAAPGALSLNRSTAFYKNTFVLGEGYLGHELAKRRSEWTIKRGLDHLGCENFARLLPGAGALASMERIDELDQNRNDDHYLHQVQHVNTVCFRGAQWTNGIFSDRNRGHWGDSVYPGVLKVRDGALAHMDPSQAPTIGDRMVEFD